ncbi:MAG TPA: HAD family hydrolase [Flavobacterium sp.]|jgi:hypothetical protein
MIKLVVTDMDGTLLRTNNSLPDDFWEVEQKLFEKGVLFAVASGRQFYNLIAVFDAIKDRTLFLAENGAYIFYKGKVIFTNPLDKKAVIDFVHIGRKIDNAFLVLSGQNSAYVESSNQKLLDVLSKHINKLEIVDDLTTVEDVFLKLSVCDFNTSETNSYHYFKHLENDFKVAVSGAIWLDITNLTATKGAAIQTIQKQFGISFEETMVFGDFMNDFEMMQTAKFSYAMKNAHPEIKNIANFITTLDNNENGVTETIKEMIL